MRFCEPSSPGVKFLSEVSYEIAINTLRISFVQVKCFMPIYFLLYFGNPRRRQRGGQQLWRVLNGTVGRPRKVRRNTKRFTLIPYFEILSVVSFNLSKFLPPMVLTAFALVHWQKMVPCWGCKCVLKEMWGSFKDALLARTLFEMTP